MNIIIPIFVILVALVILISAFLRENELFITASDWDEYLCRLQEKEIINNDMGYPMEFDEDKFEWVYSDTKENINENPRKCKKCNQDRTEEGHDACISNLGNVLNACCGHGVNEGYIQFDNGITIRGYFTVEKN